jgi:hypothetical protein
MAVEVRAFEFTIPAGTNKESPVTFPLAMPPREVVEVDVKIPSGPSGLCGFKIGASGVAIIPLNENKWIVGDNDSFSWPLSQSITSGAWEAFGYNLGDYSHTVYIKFQLNLVSINASRPSFINGSSLSA